MGEGKSYRKYVTSQDESVVINEVAVENAVLFVYRMIICLILNIFN